MTAAAITAADTTADTTVDRLSHDPEVGQQQRHGAAVPVGAPLTGLLNALCEEMEQREPAVGASLAGAALAAEVRYHPIIDFHRTATEDDGLIDDVADAAQRLQAEVMRRDLRDESFEDEAPVFGEQRNRQALPRESTAGPDGSQPLFRLADDMTEQLGKLWARRDAMRRIAEATAELPALDAADVLLQAALTMCEFKDAQQRLAVAAVNATIPAATE